jgi:hypothetical protein
MTLKQNIKLKNSQTAPDCSGSPEAIKAIFSRHNKATAGSSCCGFRKKAFVTRAIAKSWNRLKKDKYTITNINHPATALLRHTDVLKVSINQINVDYGADGLKSVQWYLRKNGKVLDTFTASGLAKTKVISV